MYMPTTMTGGEKQQDRVMMMMISTMTTTTTTTRRIIFFLVLQLLQQLPVVVFGHGPAAFVAFQHNIQHHVTSHRSNSFMLLLSPASPSSSSLSRSRRRSLRSLLLHPPVMRSAETSSMPTLLLLRHYHHQARSQSRRRRHHCLYMHSDGKNQNMNDYSTSSISSDDDDDHRTTFKDNNYSDDDKINDNDTVIVTTKRREFLSTCLSSSSLSALATTILSGGGVAHASGLIQFPLVDTSSSSSTNTEIYGGNGGGNTSTSQSRSLSLKNVYHLMRSGRTLLEEQDIYCSNPLLLTNRDAALSPTGRQQVLETAVTKLQQSGVQPSQIRHSLAASAMDTAQIIKDTLKVGQNRINPEFVFMDPRSVGLWEGLSDRVVKDVLLAFDLLEAKSDGTGARPPPNDDGTPNETLFDQKTRLVQLLSGLETQYSGDNILLVFPDPTSPALLQALMAGIPLNEVHLLDFEPAEIRLNVTPESTLELFEKRSRRRNADGTKDDTFLKTYEARIQHGQQELDRLLSLDATTLVSKKDEMILKEQQAIEDQLMRKKQEQEAKQALLDRQLREERQRQMEESSAARERTQQQHRMSTSTIVSSTANNKKDKNDGIEQFDLKTATIATSLAFSGAVAVFAGITPSSPSSMLNSKDDNDPSSKKMSVSSTRNDPSGTTPGGDQDVPTIDEATNLNTSTIHSRETIRNTVRDSTDNGTSGSTTTLHYSSSLSSQSPVARPPTVEERKVAAEAAMKDYLDRDDGGDDWLHLMEEILLEDDDQSDVEKELLP